MPNILYKEYNVYFMKKPKVLIKQTKDPFKNIEFPSLRSITIRNFTLRKQRYIKKNQGSFLIVPKMLYNMTYETSYNKT